MDFPQFLNQITKQQYKYVDQQQQDVLKLFKNVNQSQTGNFEIELKPQKLFDSYPKALSCTQHSCHKSHLLIINVIYKLEIINLKNNQTNIKFTLTTVFQNRTYFIFCYSMKATSIDRQDLNIDKQQQNKQIRFFQLNHQFKIHVQFPLKFCIQIFLLDLEQLQRMFLQKRILDLNMKFQDIVHQCIIEQCHLVSQQTAEYMIPKYFTFRTGDIAILDIDLENKTLMFKNKSSKVNQYQQQQTPKRMKKLILLQFGWYWRKSRNLR